MPDLSIQLFQPCSLPATSDLRYKQQARYVVTVIRWAWGTASSSCKALGAIPTTEAVAGTSASCCGQHQSLNLARA